MGVPSRLGRFKIQGIRKGQFGERKDFTRMWSPKGDYQRGGPDRVPTQKMVYRIEGIIGGAQGKSKISGEINTTKEGEKSQSIKRRKGGRGFYMPEKHRAKI